MTRPANPTRVTSVSVATTPPYEVLVADGALALLPERVREPRVALVSDSGVADTWLPPLVAALEAAGREVATLVLPAGEASKSIARFGELCRELATAGFDRSGAVVALGGGVVGDLAGFVAASFMRGLAFYNCPTSLLAMVDASVGGKNAVNLPEGKNLVGAFWQPRLVLADVRVLATLPEREFRQGAVELVKHGLLADGELVNLLEQPDFAPEGDPGLLVEAVARSVRVKAGVVAADPHERGQRAHLNLGHSLAHALEAASDHALGHGDAVAYGLLFAALLSEARGWDGARADAERLLRWLSPAPLPSAEFEPLLPFLARDKKNLGGRRRFVLLEAPQRPRLVDDLSDDELRSAWQRLLECVEGPAGSTPPAGGDR